MSNENTEYRTPGQFLELLLSQRGWTKRTLATVLLMDESSISKTVADKQPISADLALKLEGVFNVPAEKFLEVQRNYDLAIARLAARPDPGRKTRAHLFGDLPIAEMMKRSWIYVENPRDIRQVEDALVKFFRANSPEEIEILPHAAKKTQVGPDVTPAQLAWLYRVKSIAEETLVASFSRAAVLSAITKLSNMRRTPEELRKVPRILNEAGIRFVIVESLTAAKIDGVCFWLNDIAPVIGISMRHDRVDNFWFVLRHELEHVLQGHGKSVVALDSELEGERAGTGPNIPEEERVANEAAADFCVPNQMMAAFISRKAPFFSERDLLGFSKTINVHPGLVAGQLQHKTKRYDRFRNHLVKVRNIIAPSAIVDGWGDVAPVDL